MQRPQLVMVMVLAWSLIAPASAHAQANERAATAEDLFRQGLQLTRKGQFAEACPRFAESHRLDPAYGALMNLAACYEKLGRTASAWQAYVDAADTARDKGQRARAENARKKASRLAPRLVRLELRLSAGMEARGLAITRDGKPFDLVLLGNAVPVDPGTYAIVATRAGAAPWKTSAAATEPGKTLVVEVSGPIARPAADKPATSPVATAAGPSRAAPASPPPSQARAPVEPRHGASAGQPLGLRNARPAEPSERAVAPPPPARSPPAGQPGPAASAITNREPEVVETAGGGMRRGGVAVMIGGAALMATGGLLGSLASSIATDISEVEMGERFDPELERRAKRFQTSSFLCWGVGVGALVGGTAMYVTGRRRARSPSASLAPAPLRGGAAAVVTWRW